MGRVLVLPTAIGADEVMQSLGCSRSTAYALIARLRREAGLPVARGTLARVDLRTFQAYYAREYEGDRDGCAYNSEGRSGTAPTTRRSRSGERVRLWSDDLPIFRTTVPGLPTLDADGWQLTPRNRTKDTP